MPETPDYRINYIDTRPLKFLQFPEWPQMTCATCGANYNQYTIHVCPPNLQITWTYSNNTLELNR